MFRPKVARLLLALAPLAPAPQLAPGPPGRAPVVLITIDTLRADRLPAYGYTRGKTPTIDALAADGVTFENAYAQTPITLPSHASILTGTYPMFHKVQDVVGRLRDGVPTLATVLHDAGYATGAAVGSTVLSSRWRLDRGFDSYDDTFRIHVGLRQVDFDRVERPAGEVVDRALAWLGSLGGKPFFLWVHVYDPHDPYTPPAPFAEEFEDHPYDGEIAYTDAALARLVAALKTSGAYDRALVVVTADHGESLGEHREQHHGFFIYEASVRIPLIVKLPSSRFKGRRLPNTVRSVDIAPTMLEAVGARLPATIQGESLLGMMAGKRPGVDLPVYCETYYTKVHFNWSPLFGYLSGRKKYIDAPEPELYDVQQDPRELTNVLDANRALAGTLKSELFRLQARFSASGKEAESRVAIDPETMARLKSLGYVGLSASGARGTTAGLPDPKGKIQIFNQLNRGITLSRRGLADRALEAFTAVVRAEPAMPIGHFLLGTEYFDRKLYLQAIEEFILTLKHNPESNVALFSLARAYLESGQGDKAEAGLAYLLELEPEHFGARHLLSLAHARRARYDQAAAEEERALALRPDYVEGYNNLGSYYLRLDRFDAAIAAYRRALALEPKFDLARVNLALAYVRAGAWDRAIEAARAVLAADSRRPRAQLYLGQAYLGKGMKEEAREAFRKAKELDPSLNVPAIP